MKEIIKNNINILVEDAPKTPRMSVSFFFKTDKKEKLHGTNILLSRLLLQGTKKMTGAQIALAFENECIDASIKSKQDYLKASLVFLNEDFFKAMELIKDLLLNSTFNELQKEKFKLKNEIISDLDSSSFKLTDCFVKNIFKDHPYSSTHTKILDDIDKITEKDIISAHKNMLNSKKAIVFVGNIEDENKLCNYFEENFDFMKSNNEIKSEIDDIFESDLKKDKKIFIEKDDAKQAQILQGWLVKSFNSDLSAPLSVLNNILGGAGLSSRLFVNLRDKKGLAYTVRSQYETLLHSAVFNMYIGTHPSNIKKSLKGFEDELKKLADTEPSEDELKGAKENISGRLKYFSQNNSQIAAIKGYNYMMGLGFDYSEKQIEQINKVTGEDVSNMAKMLLQKPKLITVLAPSEYKD